MTKLFIVSLVSLFMLAGCSQSEKPFLTKVDYKTDGDALVLYLDGEKASVYEKGTWPASGLLSLAPAYPDLEYIRIQQSDNVDTAEIPNAAPEAYEQFKQSILAGGFDQNTIDTREFFVGESADGKTVQLFYGPNSGIIKINVFAAEQ